MIERSWDQTSHGAGKCTGFTDRTLRGFEIVSSRVVRGCPDNPMFDRIERTQGRNITVASGGCSRNVSDRLGGDGWRQKSSKSEIIQLKTRKV